jgi:hypothetical protein
MAGTGMPAGEPAPRLYALPSIRERIADNLALLATALATFILSSVVAPLLRLDRWWLVVAAGFALGAVVAVMALLRHVTPPRRLRRLALGLSICALGTLAAGFALRPAPVDFDLDTTLVLLDTSQAMGDPLPDKPTKLASAVESVSRIADNAGLYEQLGLATFGVDDCGDRPPYRMRMKISAAGEGRLDRAVAGLRPDGRSNLAAAARRALGEMQPFSGKVRRLLVITGGDDQCPGDLDEVVERARTSGVMVGWDIVGLGLTAPLPVQPSGNVRLHYANSQAELEAIVDRLLVNDPATREFDALQDFLDERVRPEFNGATAALGDRDVTRADAHLKALTTQFQEGEDRFARDPVSARVPECQAVANFERSQFGLLKDALPTLTELVELQRKPRRDWSAEQTRAYEELDAAWKQKVKVYNERLETLPDLIRHCLAALSRPD